MGSISHNQVTVSICFKIILYVLVFIVSQVDGQNTPHQLNITFIADAITKGAVCLDGTPGAYYFSKGFGDGINSWMIFLPGGAWCATKEGCLNRSSTGSGFNKNHPRLRISLGTFQSTNKTINPDFYYWNFVAIQYCDGASFMADVEVVNPETNLHLRGRRIFTSAIEELMSTQGMSNAENALLIGNSAGGLATILNCDRFHSLLPDACRVKCISDSGFFIRAEHLRGAQDNASDYFGKVVLFHISELVVPNKVDWNNCTAEFSKLSSCTENQQHIIMDFQTTFLETLEKLDDNPSRGLFITSCYVHDFIYKPSNWRRIPTLQNKASFHILSVLTEGSDYQDPECYKLLPPDCLDAFYHEMCKNASDAVAIPDKCCGYFIITLSYDCFFYGLVKQFESMHLCDDKLGSGRGIIYLVFHPKLPKYSVDNLRVSDLTLNFDMTLSARFNVRITTDNPNKKIGIYYEKGSRLSVWYKDTNLCQGTTPKFYQGHQNKTVLNVALTGQNQYGKTLLNAFQEQQQTGRVPLDLNINVPVSVKLGALKLRKVRILGTCVLTVDSLTTNSLISIKASSCHFGLKL
ncbi:hypothetical protein SASPL_136521 [Salvia splendens]|uniref:Pectin acetylesterase n=1 Tax=Salvia splendens TaxID=180675 RepID=A0A8X8X022_SALSN|nr:hypothetical protein SASPL_136521 [Salvia splendens]